MTSPSDTRRPRAFAIDDPAVVAAPPPPREEDTPAAARTAEDANDAGGFALPTAQNVASGIRWGQILVSAAVALAMLAAGLWFTRFVSVALARDDLLGWAAWSLFGAMALAALVLIMREIIGLMRLARLGTLRRDTEAALTASDPAAERQTVDRLMRYLANRPELKWGHARLSEHLGDVHRRGDLMRIAERELVVPLDGEARRLILASSKRVSMVTAISPMAWIAMLYVLIENLRMLRALASLYGGKPGFVGGLKLGRMVIAHIIASGGVAMTDDLVGQFLGQDLLRRVSQRLGEGAFNGALTARVGVAAINLIRPLPFLEATPIRLRDMVGELMRRRKGGKDATSGG
jgi:putative membrane protein